MPARNQTQIFAAMDKASDGRIRKVAKSYKRGVTDPIVAAIRKAKSPEGALRNLGPTLVRRIDDAALVNELTDHLVQSGLQGAVAGSKRKPEREETS